MVGLNRGFCDLDCKRVFFSVVHNDVPECFEFVKKIMKITTVDCADYYRFKIQ